jgi:hypothetical protein
VPLIGFLHTAESLAEPFNDLVADTAPEADAIHRVNPYLLTYAREHGMTDALRSLILADLRLLAELTNVVVCTCSTLGTVTEEVGAELPVSVMRIDRPMAEQAARCGDSVAVVATLTSALSSAIELLEECGVAELEARPCFDAWPLFEAGDQAGYDACVAAHVRVIAPQFGAVVLAQASMAGVEPMLADVEATVLCSPRLAVEAAARQL